MCVNRLALLGGLIDKLVSHGAKAPSGRGAAVVFDFAALPLCARYRWAFQPGSAIRIPLTELLQ